MIKWLSTNILIKSDDDNPMVKYFSEQYVCGPVDESYAKFFFKGCCGN